MAVYLKKGNLYEVGDPITGLGVLLNNSDKKLQGDLIWEIFSEKKKIMNGSFPVVLGPDSRSTLKLNLGFAKERGPYMLKTFIKDKKRVLQARVNTGFVVIRSLGKRKCSNSFVGLHESNREVVADLKRIEDVGFRYFRHALRTEWKRVEPLKNKWNWPQRINPENVCFKYLGLLGFAPEWAIDIPSSIKWRRNRIMPRNLSEWATYVRETVSNLPYITDWEVWNEPNTHFFLGTPAEYSELCRIAYTEVKNINPNAKVWGISIAGVHKKALAFAREVCNAGGSPYMDGFSFHSYQPKEPEYGQMLTGISQLKEISNEFGGEKKNF